MLPRSKCWSHNYFWKLTKWYSVCALIKVVACAHICEDVCVCAYAPTQIYIYTSKTNMYTYVCVSVYVINQVYGIIFFLSNNLISLTWVLPPKHPLLSYLDSSSYLSHIQHHNPVCLGITNLSFPHFSNYRLSSHLCNHHFFPYPLPYQL